MDSPEKAFERSTRPRGSGDYYQNKLVSKNVLVGSLKDKADPDLRWCLEQSCRERLIY
ncbi:hypothetical protein [Paenibacillus baimaensis]|nr:hypothetical protein [Paenibacillus sp. WQ 127069]